MKFTLHKTWTALGVTVAGWLTLLVTSLPGGVTTDEQQALGTALGVGIANVLAVYLARNKLVSTGTNVDGKGETL